MINYSQKYKKDVADPAQNNDPDYAVKQLGLSLHPLQDYIAHGDFGKNSPTGDTYVWHNMGSPQRLSWYGWAFDNPANYPDDPNLDADGFLGRPAGNALKYTRITGEYAIFHSGSQRITVTQLVTEKELKEFQQHLKTQKKCCRCFKYFGISK